MAGYALALLGLRIRCMVGVVVAAAGKSDVCADEEEFRSPRIGRSAP